MSKTKNWLWDEAENFVDQVVAKIKSNVITLEQGIEEIKQGVITLEQGSKEIKDNKDNYALELVGIEYDDQVDEYLYYAMGGK